MDTIAIQHGYGTLELMATATAFRIPVCVLSFPTMSGNGLSIACVKLATITQQLVHIWNSRNLLMLQRSTMDMHA